MKNRFSLARVLLVSLIVVTGLGAPRMARAQDRTSIARVGLELARFNKPGALYAFLRDEHADFFALADASDLAEALDGKIKPAEFQRRFDATLASSSLPQARKDAATSDAAAFAPVLATLTKNAGPVLGLGAEEIRSQKSRDLVPELRNNLFDASKHWMTDLWGSSRVGSTRVRFVPGSLAWFNPEISIPELGIRAGVPLTEEQKVSVAKLFSFEVVEDPKASAEGTVAFPTWVGRAVNPTSNVLTVVNDRGEVLSDLVAKGGGQNFDIPAYRGRNGRLETSHAVLDGEVSRNLHAAGANNFNAVAVITLDSDPTRAIYIRAPRTLVRHWDMGLLSKDEMKATLDRIVNETAIREGLPSLTREQWIKDYLPRLSGENAGILSGLGILHGRMRNPNGALRPDNNGMGELVDFSEATLQPPGVPDQAEAVWENIKLSISRMSQVLGQDLKSFLPNMKTVFDDAFATGRAKGMATTLKIDPVAIGRIADEDLIALAEKSVPAKDRPAPIDPGTRDGALALLGVSDHVAERISMSELTRMNVPELYRFAGKNGITLPAKIDKASLIAAISKRPDGEIRGLLARTTKVDVRPGVDPRGPGMSDRLKALVRDRSAVDRDVVR